MLTSFDREDLEDLYKFVKAKFGSTRPVEDLDLLLWGDLKTMFEPHKEDKVWKRQQGYKVLEWKVVAAANNPDSINESVTTAPSIFAASSKAKVSTFPNVDSLSDAVIYSFFAKVSQKNWKKSRSPKDNKNKETTRRTVPVQVSNSNDLVSQCDAVGGCDWCFQADEEPTNYALMAYTSSGTSSSLGSDNKNETLFEEDIRLLKHDVMLRDNALAEHRKKFEKAKKERNDLKLTLDIFQTSSKNLSKLLESQVSDKTDLGFDSQVINCQVFECEELHSYESDNRVPKNLENDSKHKTGKDKSKTHRLDATIIEDWISDFEDEIEIESVPKQREPSFAKSTEHVKTSRESVKKVKHNKQAENLRTNNQKSIVRLTHPHSNRKVVPIIVLTRLRLVSLNAARPVPIAVTLTVKSTWPVKHVVNKGNKGNAEKASAYWVWKLKYKVLNHVSRLTSASMTLKKFDYTDALGRSNVCSRHMTGNISFLSKFEEIDGGYVAFGGNPKGGKISRKDTECVVLSSDYKLPDKNYVLLRVPRENNMYNVGLKNVVPSG
nr:hypothetical protein [Tanacetum cinerariifolium]